VPVRLPLTNPPSYHNDYDHNTTTIDTSSTDALSARAFALFAGQASSFDGAIAAAQTHAGAASAMGLIHAAQLEELDCIPTTMLHSLYCQPDHLPAPAIVRVFRSISAVRSYLRLPMPAKSAPQIFRAQIGTFISAGSTEHNCFSAAAGHSQGMAASIAVSASAASSLPLCSSSIAKSLSWLGSRSLMAGLPQARLAAVAGAQAGELDLLLADLNCSMASEDAVAVALLNGPTSYTLVSSSRGIRRAILIFRLCSFSLPLAVQRPLPPRGFGASRLDGHTPRCGCSFSLRHPSRRRH